MGRPRRAERDLPRHRRVVGTGQGGAVRGGVGYAQLGRGRRGQATANVNASPSSARASVIESCDPASPAPSLSRMTPSPCATPRVALRGSEIVTVSVSSCSGVLPSTIFTSMAFSVSPGGEVDRCTPGFVVVPRSCRAVRCREVTDTEKPDSRFSSTWNLIGPSSSHASAAIPSVTRMLTSGGGSLSTMTPTPADPLGAVVDPE